MTSLVFPKEIRNPAGRGFDLWPKDDQGITHIELEGSTLRVLGWFDSIAGWGASVELTDEQRAQLRDAL